MRHALLPIALAASLIFPARVHACKCAPFQAKTLYTQAHLIFTATVVAATLDKTAPPHRQMRLQVHVAEILKGKPAQTMTVFAPAYGLRGGCGYPISIGNLHLFVLNNKAEGNICSGNGEIGGSSCHAEPLTQLLAEFQALSN